MITESSYVYRQVGLLSELKGVLSSNTHWTVMYEYIVYTRISTDPFK